MTTVGIIMIVFVYAMVQIYRSYTTSKSIERLEKAIDDVTMKAHDIHKDIRMLAEVMVKSHLIEGWDKEQWEKLLIEVKMASENSFWNKKNWKGIDRLLK